MIRIITVGKLKEDYLRDGCNEYIKRLSKYTKLELIEINDESINDSSEVSINKAINSESKRILDKISDKEYVILLAIKGKQLNSEEFANNLNSLLDQGNKLTFIIGGSYGVNKEVYDRADLLLSFSNLTFPHQLFRMMLLEQIYRCYKIINKEKYHK